LIRVPFVNLVNLVMERAAVPELLQEDCTGEKLAEAALRLLRNLTARAAQQDAFNEALLRLGRGKGVPSERAADVVLATIAEYAEPT
jgi:lipid-A-disaccharide synthase